MTSDETNPRERDAAAGDAAEGDAGSAEPPAERSAARDAAPGAHDAQGADDDRTQPAVGIEPKAPPEPSLEERLEKAHEDIKANRERMLRVAADFENYRKRTSRELEEVKRRSVQDAVKTLLPVFDNLERATAHLDEATEAKSMAEGIQMVHRQFIDTLAKLDIERIPSVGSPFDPAVHESIQYEHSDEHAAGSIMTELQPGYRMGPMLLRPALVVVSRGPQPASAEGDATSAAGGEESSNDAS